MNDKPQFVLNRETIRSGDIRAIVKEHDPSLYVLSDEELFASLRGTIADRPADEDIWLFGYGSLIWNPTIAFAERRSGTIFGYHRRFCLRTRLGRGTPDLPGVVLGLDRGGCCRGVAFRIERDQAEYELELVWRREMLSNAYSPRWLRMETAEGPVTAVGFVMNRDHDRYCGALDEDELAGIIDEAAGVLGPCSDYLFNTVDHLEELGIPDSGLTRLRDKVLARRERKST